MSLSQYLISFSRYSSLNQMQIRLIVTSFTQCMLMRLDKLMNISGCKRRSLSKLCMNIAMTCLHVSTHTTSLSVKLFTTKCLLFVVLISVCFLTTKQQMNYIKQQNTFTFMLYPKTLIYRTSKEISDQEENLF